MVSAYTRATDGDRNDACQVLDAALGDGQLSTEEHRERVSAVTKATTLGELRGWWPTCRFKKPALGGSIALAADGTVTQVAPPAR